MFTCLLHLGEDRADERHVVEPGGYGAAAARPRVPAVHVAIRHDDDEALLIRLRGLRRPPSVEAEHDGVLAQTVEAEKGRNGRALAVARGDVDGILPIVAHLPRDAGDGQVVSAAEVRRVVAGGPVSEIARLARGGARAADARRAVRGTAVRCVVAGRIPTVEGGARVIARTVSAAAAAAAPGIVAPAPAAVGAAARPRCR